MKRLNNHQKNLMILSGGKSRRMGSDKATLPFGHCTVIEYMIREALPYFDHIYISAADEDQLAQIGQMERVSFVYDLVKGVGPVGALYALFKQTDVQDACVIAVDMPFAAFEHLQMLYPEAGVSVAYRIAVHQRHKEPLYGWYSRSCLDVLTQMIEAQSYKLGMLHSMVSGQQMEVQPWALQSDPSLHEMFNMNTREDYYKALDVVRYEAQRIPAIAFAGWSGTGKTTYIEQLIPKLLERSIRLAVIKHDGHDFEMDVEGKDTWRYRQAGAREIMISSSTQYAHICQVDQEMSLEALMQQVRDVDLILVEGWKFGDQPKILLDRAGTTPLDVDTLKQVVAVITDQENMDCGLPVYHWDDFDGVADFIVNFALDLQADEDVEAFLENL